MDLTFQLISYSRSRRLCGRSVGFVLDRRGDDATEGGAEQPGLDVAGVQLAEFRLNHRIQCVIVRCYVRYPR